MLTECDQKGWEKRNMHEWSTVFNGFAERIPNCKITKCKMLIFTALNFGAWRLAYTEGREGESREGEEKYKGI